MYEDLFDGYLSGTLSPDEARRLSELLESDPKAAEAFVRHVRETSLMVQIASQLAMSPSTPVTHSVGGAAPETPGIPALAAEEGAQGRKPSTRRGSRSWRTRSSRSSWAPALVAAGIFVSTVLFFAVLSPGSGRETPGTRGTARVRPENSAEAGRDPAREAALREEERRQAAARLREIDRERERLLAKPGVPEEKPAPEQVAERAKALAELESRKRRIEEEMRAAVERERSAPAGGGNPASQKPARPQESPREKSQDEGTQPTVAKLERVEGEVWAVGRSGRSAAQAKQAIRGGEGLEVGEKGLAVVVYPDQTRVEVTGPTTVREFKAERGKRIFIEKGTVRAEVAKQPKGEPAVLATPHAEVTVLGTTLRIIVDPDPKKGTRLEVEEGKVQLKNLAGKTVDVPSGHYAVAAVGVELVAKALPTDEILLRPRGGKIAGKHWRIVRDEGASTGLTLEVSEVLKATEVDSMFANKILGYVEFTFNADADKEYFVWVRGCCTATQDRGGHDSVVLLAPQGRFSGTYAEFGLPGNIERGFNGFGHREGYWWVGGNADPGTNGKPEDEIPLSVRFSRSGRQTLRLYPMETPIRIDAIWLSVLQKTRPDNQSTGPGIKK